MWDETTARFISLNMFYICLNHYFEINNKSNNNKGQSVSHLESEGKKLARGNI